MLPLLTAEVAVALLKARKEGGASASVSLDLNLSHSTVEVGEAGALGLPWNLIEKAAKNARKVFLVEDGELREASAFSEVTGWVRALTPTTGAPTVLVSGIPMHRIKDTDPQRDTRAKIAAISPIKGRVLDTATGLGYTAIGAAECSAEVVTVELDPAAIEIARINPWSQGLFDNPKITLIIGDIEEEIDNFRDGEFSAILHDPPTIQLAGGLYSLEFYRQMKRVLARKGKLFHYVGDPNSNLGHRITQGVMRRLSEAGFQRVQRRADAFGVLASA